MDVTTNPLITSAAATATSAANNSAAANTDASIDSEAPANADSGSVEDTASGGDAIANARASWSAERYADRLPRSYADQVSLSYKSQQLSQISSEFFSGTIRSDQIPALTQRLYEGGLINTAEYQSLGGVEQKVSAVSEAQSFLSQQMMSSTVQAQPEVEAGFAQVLDVLRNMDAAVTPQARQAEQQAMAFITDYRAEQEAAGASEDLLQGLDQVMDVLTALEKVRNNEQATGALASYNSVQEAYDESTQSN
ncbi:hypothetical protein CHH28_17565 [Bacterioplanes sanyensis]|uniref:Uncharacterized protein n=1 Tax=Bacterioplanes sanyensis TaxID=1249553 RepID=A0A222FQ55_9GAMM|nr:hypothetical protein [Bacterioplanes sanyensis]ASP40373.1 hypothetical protein CHH28_17565 [Bacterioplanes sanyensis]